MYFAKLLIINVDGGDDKLTTKPDVLCTFDKNSNLAYSATQSGYRFKEAWLKDDSENHDLVGFALYSGSVEKPKLWYSGIISEYEHLIETIPYTYKSKDYRNAIYDPSVEN